MVTDDAPEAGDNGDSVDISDETQLRLTRHLKNWLGDWPTNSSQQIESSAIRPSIVVTSSTYRETPGWDGVLRPIIGVSSPLITVISVARRFHEAIADAVERGGLDEFERDLSAVIDHPGALFRRGVFRYQQRLVANESRGEWLPTDDPLVPEWLRIFNGEVLVAFDEHRHYVAGVGCKRHDQFAQELAITTAPMHRRQGYAKELVAQAAQRVFEEGGVATYLHRRDNLGSAAVADATGFFDQGWEILSLSAPGV